MAYKIYIKNNFLYVDDTELVPRALVVGGRDKFRIEEVAVGSETYYISRDGDKITNKAIPLSEILKENDVVYTATELEDFITTNLDFKSSQVGEAILAYRELLGHGDYHDSLVSNQVFDGTPKKLLINGLGANTEKRGLPITGELYDTTTNKIVGIYLMDKGDLRITLTVDSATSNPTRIDVVLDIGTSPTAITIPIAYDSFTLRPGYPQKVQFNMPWYSADTFIANGGQLFISVNSGTATVSNRTLFISKDIAGM